MKAPRFLRKGDKVRIVSPAGAIEPGLVDGAASCLRSWGFEVVIAPNAKTTLGRFAGNKAERLADLQEALDDPDCTAILCSRGGYGTIHLMEHLSWKGFEKHPKWVIGYSDITMLHGMIQQIGWQSIHGGMAKALSEFVHKKESDQITAASSLRQILQGNPADIEVESHLLNRCGTSSGILRGGNLSILYSLRGTPYEFLPPGCILFIEDIGEKPYVIDRIMHNLRLGGILEKISGLIVGQFTDYEEDPLFGQSVYEIIEAAVSEYSYPVCFGFPSGHVDYNLPLLCGAPVQLEVKPVKSALKWNI